MKLKTKIITLLILFPFLLIAKKVPLQKAILVAKNWTDNMNINSNNILDVFIETYNCDTSFYMINFMYGGFVIIPADDRINPILAYSYNGNIKPDTTDNAFRSLMLSYKTKIDYIKKQKSDNKNEITRIKWDNILNGNFKNSLLNKNVDVPSLFETNQTSRWASWHGYNILLPNQDGTNICVPLAMAQICKYHKHPKQGVGTNSYYVNGNYCNIDYNQHLYNYDLMPFRLTYCNNGEENCNEGSWDFLPEIVEENKEEISTLIYHVGLGVEMRWEGLGGSGGTSGLPNSWASIFSQYLNYKNNWVYWNNSNIYNTPELFKEAMRNSLINDHPILFRIGPLSGGHAIVIDGYENDEYFHASFGRGGYSDAYYYLFIDDDDGVHLPISSSTNYYAVLDIEPNYDFPQTINLNTPISQDTIKSYQAFVSVSISTIIDGNGTTGAKVAIYSNDVYLNEGFEIKKGAELYINNENY